MLTPEGCSSSPVQMGLCHIETLRLENPCPLSPSLKHMLPDKVRVKTLNVVDSRGVIRFGALRTVWVTRALGRLAHYADFLVRLFCLEVCCCWQANLYRTVAYSHGQADKVVTHCFYMFNYLFVSAAFKQTHSYMLMLCEGF